MVLYLFKKKLCKKFLVQYRILRKVLDFISFQDHSRISRVVLSSPVPSQIFPDFFVQLDQKTLVLSWYGQFRKWPPDPSCLVSKKSSGTQTSIANKLKLSSIRLGRTTQFSPIILGWATLHFSEQSHDPIFFLLVSYLNLDQTEG